MGTKKILNKDVSNVVEESLAGYLMACLLYTSDAADEL